MRHKQLGNDEPRLLSDFLRRVQEFIFNTQHSAQYTSDEIKAFHGFNGMTLDRKLEFLGLRVGLEQYKAEREAELAQIAGVSSAMDYAEAFVDSFQGFATTRRRTAVNDYESMKYADLKKVHDTIGSILKEKAAAEQQNARTAMQQLADDLGVTLAEMLGIKGTKSKANGTRKPARIKYRNPENPAETWTGKGKMPSWLQAIIEGGKEKADFLVA